MSTEPPSETIVSLGKLVAGHGVQGRARVRPFHAEGTTLLECTHVWLAPVRGASPTRFRITARQRHRHQLLVAFEGIDSLTALDPWIGAVVGIEESALPRLAGDEFYQYRAIGLAVSTIDGRPLGHVAEILSTGAHDVWVIRAPESAIDPETRESVGSRRATEYLVPVVGEIVEEIDLGARTARIRPIPGLLED